MAKSHSVSQGECLSTIAKHYGFGDYRTIYDHPLNAGFKKKRPNPNIIYPEDVIHIPDKNRREESCATGRQHRFRLLDSGAELKIVVKDAHGNPIVNSKYKLTVGDLKFSGTSGGQGLIRHTIPVGIHTGSLFVEAANATWKLNIGHLDPVHDGEADAAIVTGVQARLNNLGYFCGRVDGIPGPKTQAALKRFQLREMKRTDPDGEPDFDTREALASAHAC